MQHSVMDFKTENLTWAPTSPFLRAFLSFVHFIDRAEQCSSLIIELACLIITALTAVLVVMIVDLLVKIFILQTDQVNQTSDRTIANVFFCQKVNEPLPWPYCVLLVIKQLVIGSLLCIRDTQFHQASVFPMTEFWRLCLADLQRAKFWMMVHSVIVPYLLKSVLNSSSSAFWGTFPTKVSSPLLNIWIKNVYRQKGDKINSIDENKWKQQSSWCLRSAAGSHITFLYLSCKLLHSCGHKQVLHLKAFWGEVVVIRWQRWSLWNRGESSIFGQLWLWWVTSYSCEPKSTAW